MVSRPDAVVLASVPAYAAPDETVRAARPDDDLASAAMRPSATFNAALKLLA